MGHTGTFSTVKIIELYISNYWWPERGQKSEEEEEEEERV